MTGSLGWKAGSAASPTTSSRCSREDRRRHRRLDRRPARGDRDVTLAYVPTGPADLRDQEWLDGQVADLGRGIEAARAIWSNWFEGRHVGRLHPGMDAGQYIASLGMRLTLPEALAAMPDASTRQVAAVAGVSHMTVAREREAAPVTDVTPAPIRGADGKSYPRVVREVKAEIIEEAPKGGGRSRITVTEARQQVRILQGVLSMLRPDEVVPSAHDIVRELLPVLIEWSYLWSEGPGTDPASRESTA